MTPLTKRELDLIRVTSCVAVLANDIGDFKKATSIVAKDNPDYWSELWEVYFIAVKGENDAEFVRCHNSLSAKHEWLDRVGKNKDKPEQCVLCNKLKIDLYNKNKMPF